MKALRGMIVSLTIFLLLFMPDGAAAQPDYIRLHILANSDSLSDQVLKLCVRDDVREAAKKLLSGCTDADTAWRVVCDNRQYLSEAAAQSAARHGFTGGVSLETGVSDFPQRQYGGETVPAGAYRAVRIVLGAGEGRNWWCVVYPGMCLPSDADVDRPVEFYSAIWRWLVRIREAVFS